MPPAVQSGMSGKAYSDRLDTKKKSEEDGMCSQNVLSFHGPLYKKSLEAITGTLNIALVSE